MRDEFLPKVKDVLAKRVSFCCSNPECGMSTVGPHSDIGSVTNIGVAAHITAASPDGPRYNSDISTEQRKSLDNGIWLCQSCAKLIDSDPAKFTIDLLAEWKTLAERKAADRLNRQLSNTQWPLQEDPPIGTLEENGYYEKDYPSGKVRVFLQAGYVHIEQELRTGATAYYVSDFDGNLVNFQLPYSISDWTVEIDPTLILKRVEEILPDGCRKEVISMKWGKSTTLVWDSNNKLKDFHIEKGCRIDPIRRVFAIEVPTFKKV